MSNINLTPKEAADRMRLAVITLAHWRVAGTGPRFIKFGRRVLYPLAEIEAYERAQLHTANSVKAKAPA
jgi:hypothetical protein